MIGGSSSNVSVTKCMHTRQNAEEIVTELKEG